MELSINCMDFGFGKVAASCCVVVAHTINVLSPYPATTVLYIHTRKYKLLLRIITSVCCAKCVAFSEFYV